MWVCGRVCQYRYINGPWLFPSLKWYLHRLLCSVLVNSCTRHWLWKNDEPIFVTNVSSQWKQLYFSDCSHSSRRAEEATWYLHLPSVGSLLLALSCFQQPQSTLLFWQENPPDGTNESWNPFLSAVLSRCSIREFFTDSTLWVMGPYF